MAETYKEIKTLTKRNTPLTSGDYVLVMSPTGAVNWMLATMVRDFMSQGVSTKDTVTITQNNQPYQPGDGKLINVIVIISPQATNFSLGTTAGAEDVWFSTAIPANIAQTIVINYYTPPSTTLFINGLPGGSTVNFYKQ